MLHSWEQADGEEKSSGWSWLYEMAQGSTTSGSEQLGLHIQIKFWSPDPSSGRTMMELASCVE